MTKINPVEVIVPLLYPMEASEKHKKNIRKTSEKHRFFDIFSGYKREHWPELG